ncbi:MAG: N-acetylmuramoyl-L-alanine amidase [Robiginitomaculum sp.]|nr:N-acetylmuramoyl-L-alanine amidase [Robiginitomaculum sp.]
MSYIFVGCLILVSSGVFAAEVVNLRFSGNSEQTRIVIELDSEQEYRWFTLASQGSRLVVDFPKLGWNINGSGAIDQAEGGGHGLIAKYRFAKNTKETSRLVFDLSEPIEVTREFYLAPSSDNSSYRLVIDLKKIDLISFITNVGVYEPFTPAVDEQQGGQSETTIPEPQLVVVLAPSLKYGGPKTKRVIVIDAGHGGKDPGAVGTHKKTREKHVNLRAALALKKRLEKSGKYKVYLTRSTDRFIELEDRVKIARNRQADLFISLHADAAANKNARGSSVYTLAERARGRSRREILKGNDWLIDVDLAAAAPEVNAILIDLSARQTKNQSAVFAELLVPELAKAGPLLGNTHRNGNLFVLLAPDVPAVLIEIGFLSNRQDEIKLNTKRYITKITNSIGDAVDKYFRQTDRLHASN